MQELLTPVTLGNEQYYPRKPVDDGFTPWSYDEELTKFADDVDDAYKDCFGY